MGYGNNSWVLEKDGIDCFENSWNLPGRIEKEVTGLGNPAPTKNLGNNWNRDIIFLVDNSIKEGKDEDQT